MVSSLLNVDRDLATKLASELGMKLLRPMPKALKTPVTPEITVSPALSVFSQPGDGRIATRRIAILMLVGLHAGAKQALPDFVKAIARHRHFERAMDPPAV